MANITMGQEYVLGAPDVLTRLYPNGIIEAFAAKNPTYGLFGKKDVLKEAGKELNWQVSSGAGDAGDIAEAEEDQAPGTHVRPFIKRSREYGTATVDRETLMATQDKDAIVEVWQQAIKDCNTNMQQSWGMHIYADGSGIRGQCDDGGTNNYASTTIKLKNPNDVKRFRIGMWVQAASGTPGNLTLRNSGAKVQITGRSITNGTLTLAGNWSATITNIADGDYLARAGDMVPVNGVGVVKGFGAWCPKTVPGASDSFFGVNRSTLGEGAYGHRPPSNSSSLYNIGVKAAGYMHDMGCGDPDIWLVNSQDMASIVQDLSGISMIQIPSQGKDGQLIGNIGYDAVKVRGIGGGIDIVPDPWIKSGDSWMGNREEFEWWLMGDLIQLVTLGMGKDGGYVTSGVDGISMRFSGFGQGVMLNPYQWSYVALPTGSTT